MNKIRFRTKPFWLRWLTGPRTWVAIAPCIYHPKGKDPSLHPALIEHEKTHIAQQRAKGLYKWLFRYLTSKKFRLHQEVEAIAVEIANTPAKERSWLAHEYASQLAGKQYRRAAPCAWAALEMIKNEVRRLEGGQQNGKI